ncbi:MAG TPA: hypothetical protein VEN81_16045, partial [Planctomycetota bacterium]|nr:hypothetical protein [Planctomycetota bacterium]
KKPKSGGYRFGSGLLWAAGQFGYNWFITYEMGGWRTLSAVVSAFVAGWTTALILGRFAKWGAGYKAMMLSGILVGVAVFSGAFSGLSSALEWWETRSIKIDWMKLKDFLLSWSVAPPAGLGLLTGIYVRSKIPRKSEKKGK